MEDDQQYAYGLNLNTTYDVDVSQIPSINVNSDEFKELLLRLYRDLNQIVYTLNLKQNAYIVQREFISGKLLYPNPQSDTPDLREVYRIGVNVGPLPNNATNLYGHGISDINGDFSVLHIYGAASDPENLEYIPLPYATATGTENIEIFADNTNVYVSTTADYSAYTVGTIVIEYLRN